MASQVSPPNKYKLAFFNTIRFLSSPSFLVIAFAALAGALPSIITLGSFMAVLAYSGLDQFLGYKLQAVLGNSETAGRIKKMELDHQEKMKRVDLDWKKIDDKTGIKKQFEAQHNAIVALTDKVNAFDAHRTLNMPTMPNGIFNQDADWMED